ncbi:hypothetical protein EBO54_24705 [Salmonella enterica subsp. enterica serovar Bredeney]|nr:hypothetical protein [Salmonella enterica subsp. enterica serovar Bredeney]
MQWQVQDIVGFKIALMTCKISKSRGNIAAKKINKVCLQRCLPVGWHLTQYMLRCGGNSNVLIT